MKRYLNRALLYLILALAAGVFYREFTKWQGFTGRTTLGFLHTHLLALGTLLCLLLALFSQRLPLEGDRRFRLGLRLYDIGLPGLALTLLARGILQVLETPLSRGLDAALSGVAGVSHLLLGTALVLLLLALRSLATRAEAPA